MALSKKHFEAIASSFADTLETAKLANDQSHYLAAERELKVLAQTLCDRVFAVENERFDEARFLTACGF